MTPAADDDYLHPEQRARKRIDEMLVRASWVVQDYKSINLYAGAGVAVRELVTTAGPADYVLFLDRQAVGVIEAKKKGTTLSGVEWQTVKYQTHVPDELPALLVDGHLLDEQPAWLRDAQAEAIRNLELSLKANRSRALIQMATGSGKTFCAANVCERLLDHRKGARAKRILFLVDRANLGRQTLKEFQGFEVPGSGRKFTELYNVQHLTHNRFDPVASVCIGTIQRVYSMLRGAADLDENLDEVSGYDSAPERPVEVDYNPTLPIEAFDVIVVDECHRSIYGVWRQVLEYFDAFLIGLTATPGH